MSKEKPSTDDLAQEIKEMLHKKKLKAVHLAESMGKTKQFISSLMNPDQLRKKQLEALEVLKKMEDGQL
jgi:DNA-binding Xre family transcriptional regulator